MFVHNDVWIFYSISEGKILNITCHIVVLGCTVVLQVLVQSPTGFTVIFRNLI